MAEHTLPSQRTRQFCRQTQQRFPNHLHAYINSMVTMSSLQTGTVDKGLINLENKQTKPEQMWRIAGHDATLGLQEKIMQQEETIIDLCFWRLNLLQLVMCAFDPLGQDLYGANNTIKPLEPLALLIFQYKFLNISQLQKKKLI